MFPNDKQITSIPAMEIDVFFIGTHFIIILLFTNKNLHVFPRWATSDKKRVATMKKNEDVSRQLKVTRRILG